MLFTKRDLNFLIGKRDPNFAQVLLKTLFFSNFYMLRSETIGLTSFVALMVVVVDTRNYPPHKIGND